MNSVLPQRPSRQPWALLLGLLLLAGCSGLPRQSAARTHRQVGESVVFVGEEPATLAHPPAPHSIPTVRSTYLPGTNTIQYEAGRDYAWDPAAGTLRRLPGSRLPDFRTNSLFGQEDFDHSRFPGFGNGGFFAFVDYEFHPTTAWPVQARQTDRLVRTREKLGRGGPFRLVAFGDSITAGGDATRPGWIYWRRWADALQQRWPKAQIEAENGATGGDSTVQGLQRLQSKVLDRHPDLVLLAFGMNDHNVNGVPVPNFKTNLLEMIRRIRTQTGAEIVLVSTFPPNPKWHYGSHRMAEYAAATATVAAEAGCAYADLYHNWEAVVARKKCEDVLGNNINHPNDFGHWIYLQVLEAMGL